MKKLFLITLVIFCNSAAKAQSIIAVQNNSTPTFYTNLDSAIVHALNGDTIYLPGGIFLLDTCIDKCLHIIGVGHNQDSTLITNLTQISGSINLITGASGGSLIGIKLNGLIAFGTDSLNAMVNNYKVARCVFGDLTFFSSSPTNNLFHENVLSAIHLGSAQSNYFYNNFISSMVYNVGTNNVFKNNVFLGQPVYYVNLIQTSNYSLYENNIFRAGSNVGINNTNICNNNLFAGDVTGIFGTNNIINQPVSSIFINQSGSTYSYTQDYNLQPTCPGKNAGSDGTDIGIYGGMFQWKDGSIPFNPHIQQKIIQQASDANGNLNVNIKVAAQEH